MKARTSPSVLPWCPPHVPGELLYSYAARISRLNALGDSRSALFTLFGARKMIPSADLPGHLDDAMERIGAIAGFESVLALVDRSTLFPFYRFFMSPARWEQVIGMARGSNGGGLKTAMGIVANGFGASPVMRSCSRCNADTWALHGTFVWHAMHQLPGVVVCPVHGCALATHFHQSRLSHRHELHPCPACVAPQRIKSCWAPVLNRYAHLANAALQFAGRPPLPGERGSAYQSALAERGWIRGEHQVRWKEVGDALQQRFHRFAPFEFQQRLQGGAGDCPAWVRAALSSRDRFIHPVCHLLLIDLLFGSLESFTDACDLEPARAESHPIESDATDLSDLMNESISCREAAMRLGVSVTTVVIRRRSLGVRVSERRKTLFPRLIEEVKTSLRLGKPIALIASQCGVSSTSVSRLLAESPDIAAHRERVRLAAARSFHRTLWTVTLEAYPGAGVKAIRRVVGATYAWLYRNDRAWLQLNPPEGLHRCVPVDRIDWLARDDLLSSKVGAAVLRLSKASPAKAITSARIVSEICSESTARVHASKLPIFWRAVQTHAETHAQFKERNLKAGTGKPD